MERWLERYARTSFQRSADTNHDLKTPLNVAVLNLELMRMRARGLAGREDEKLQQYGKAVEFELHRMAQIFDTYFVYATPPRNYPSPAPVDLNASSVQAAELHNVTLAAEAEASTINAHATRISELFRFVFDGVSKLLDASGRAARTELHDGHWTLRIGGKPAHPGVELEKLFKFYYTDPSGNPELSLATARLIAETYGGSITAVASGDSLSIDVELPLGDS